MRSSERQIHSPSLLFELAVYVCEKSCSSAGLSSGCFPFNADYQRDRPNDGVTLMLMHATETDMK